MVLKEWGVAQGAQLCQEDKPEEAQHSLDPQCDLEVGRKTGMVMPPPPSEPQLCPHHLQSHISLTQQDRLSPDWSKTTMKFLSGLKVSM